MALRAAGQHVRKASASTGSRAAERRRVGRETLLSSVFRAITLRRAYARVGPSTVNPRQTRCSLHHQPIAAPWPTQPSQHKRRSPTLTAAVRPRIGGRAAVRATAAGPPTTEAGAEQPGAGFDADSEGEAEAASDGESEGLREAAPEPDARLDPGLYLVATPIGTKNLPTYPCQQDSRG